MAEHGSLCYPQYQVNCGIVVIYKYKVLIAHDIMLDETMLSVLNY